MQIKDIEEYARALWEQSGPKSIAMAAQKAVTLEQEGEAQAAETWRKIEASLMTRRGANQG
ncbi:MAG: hypothetical protein AAGE80_18535 [Pseudomonadota bacterium]